MPGKELATGLILGEALEGAEAALSPLAPDVPCGLGALARQAQKAAKEMFTGAEGDAHAHIVGSFRGARGVVALWGLAGKKMIANVAKKGT